MTDLGEADDQGELLAAGKSLVVAVEPDESAGLYLFLASPAARAMTGQILRPDGGLSVR